jgi:RNA polymerase primary sigma factor
VILHNQSIVYQIAKDYGKNEEEISDFIMEGNLGLYEAMKRFDYSKDNKFYTYARWWIMAYMSYYASSDYTLVRVPSYGGALRRARKIENDYFLEHGRYPTIEEVKDIITNDISEKTGNPKYKVPYVEGIYDMDYISLGLTYGEECDTTFEESDEFVNRTQSYNQYEELSEEEYNKTMLLPLLNLLDPDEKTIIMKLYQIGKYKGYTKYQVCQEYNLKERDIDRISKRLLKRMKDGAKNINL